MNEDDNNPFQPVADEVTEARIVAWVLGEASAFEIAELERLCDEKPELAAFHRRMVALQGLLDEACSDKQEDGWKLPFSKMQPLGKVLERPSVVITDDSGSRKRSLRRGYFRAMVGIAACLSVSAVIWRLNMAERNEGSYGALGTTGEIDVSVPTATEGVSPLPSKVQLEEAIREQESRVEMRRRELSKMVREKGIVFSGDASIFDGAEKSEAQAKLKSASYQDEGNPLAAKQEMKDAMLGKLDSIRPRSLSPLSPPPEEEDRYSLAASGGAGGRNELLMEVDKEGELTVPADLIKPGEPQGFDLGSVMREEGSSLSDGLSSLAAREAKLEAAPDPFAPVTPAAASRISEKKPKEWLGFDSDYSSKVPPGDLPKLGTAAIADKPIDLGEISAAEEAFSTFSLNVSDVSFRLAKATLENGGMPDPAEIKIEQFYNAIDYGDPAPSGDPVAGVVEQSAHPVVPGRNLVRLGVKTAAAGRSAAQPLRLTLLIDQSGSMVRDDRKEALGKALAGLGEILTDTDRVSVIGFSRTATLLADGVDARSLKQVTGSMNQDAAEAGTNLEEALKLAGEIALRQKLGGAQNRIVLFTDGAANLGDADPARLAERVKALRQSGVAVDIAGIGADGLNDRLLAELARHGNGRYYIAAENLGVQLAGAFRPAAEDVKVQVRFNPERVSRYKLIGFDKDRLNKEDFRNDAVDAAELSSEEAAVALYQVELLPAGKGEIGEMTVRFRDAASRETIERSWTIPFDEATPAFDLAKPSMQLAGLSMLVAEKLKGGPISGVIDFRKFSTPIASVKKHYEASRRTADMIRTIGLLPK